MSEIGFGNALYYPYIHLQNEAWLKSAALYYDRLSRIVPDDFVTNDSDIVKRLNAMSAMLHILTVGGSVQVIYFREGLKRYWWMLMNT